jgi:luciferase-type oxidoreductase
VNDMTALDCIAPKGGPITLGLELPLDNDFAGPTPGLPDLTRHAELARLAETSGFAALWLRDVIVYDPVGFGDAAQIFEPFTYLGYLAAITDHIVLGTAAIVSPLRQPLLVAKASASVAHLSRSRLILGIASGDRPVEYPLFGVDFESRGQRLRENVRIMRAAWDGTLFDKSAAGLALLPRPDKPIPMIMAGGGQQSVDWTAEHMDGWFSYPDRPEGHAHRHALWQAALDRVGGGAKPMLTAMRLDLVDDPASPLVPIRLGARLGRQALLELIEQSSDAGISHLSLNLRASRRPVAEVMQELSEDVLPHAKRVGSHTKEHSAHHAGKRS